VRVVDTPLDGVKLVEADVFGDDRGFFMETFNSGDFEKSGLPTTFVQDNHSRSAGGVLRGLHYQYPTWQGKLVRVVEGEIFDVAVDIRPGSTSFGKWYGLHLSATNKHQLYVPEGFAHGFCVLSDSADVVYKCTTLYARAEDRCVSWNDPDIGIDWPVSEPLVSVKDASGGRLRDLET